MRFANVRELKNKTSEILRLADEEGDVGSKTTCQVKEQMGKQVADLKHYIKML
jgi:hypothetical protein